MPTGGPVGDSPEGGIGLDLGPNGPEGDVEPGSTPAVTPGLADAPGARAQPPLRALPPTPPLDTVNPEVPAHEGTQPTSDLDQSYIHLLWLPYTTTCMSPADIGSFVHRQAIHGNLY